MVTSCYVMWAAGGKQFRLEAASLRQCDTGVTGTESVIHPAQGSLLRDGVERGGQYQNCLLYTSPSPRDLSTSRMPSSA